MLSIGLIPEIDNALLDADLQNIVISVFSICCIIDTTFIS